MPTPKPKLVSTTEFKIERGIPAPLPRDVGYNKYPFGRMDIGESFLAPAGTSDRVRAAAYAYSRTHPGLKFTVSRVVGGFRVWRVA